MHAIFVCRKGVQVHGQAGCTDRELAGGLAAAVRAGAFPRVAPKEVKW